jgi:hypothetical protein
MKNVVAVRWLGAYHHNSASLIESAKWELKAEREVAFAYMHPNGPRVGDSFVGLLVDVQKSAIRTRFLGDGYTVLEYDGTLKNTRSYEVRVKPGQTPKLARRKSAGGLENDYDEGVGILSFLGVVVHHTASREQRKIAISIAEAIGLPYLGSLTGPLKPVLPRRTVPTKEVGGGPKVCPVKRFRNLKPGVKAAKALLTALGLEADGDMFEVIDKERVLTLVDWRLVYITFKKVDGKTPDWRSFTLTSNMWVVASGLIQVSPEGEYSIEVEQVSALGRHMGIRCEAKYPDDVYLPYK